ncbi:MAG: acetyl-CoA carboxylase biotin carboxyl carrier protein subunit [Anaerolineales bacterium]|nr:acetyl-CoA carboxylase biotin carboxyl carrier protein subunit [Anaerolineales bacterium]
MKITVKIDGEAFEVEVGPLNERPVTAQVDGLAFEVWPEGEAPFQAKQPAAKAALPPSQKNTGTNWLGKDMVAAPIPGSIFLLKVQAGEQVQAGQELCILEAMKMKNIIRAPRAGRIAAVKVENGQQVAEGDVIVIFES